MPKEGARPVGIRYGEKLKLRAALRIWHDDRKANQNAGDGTVAVLFFGKPYTSSVPLHDGRSVYILSTHLHSLYLTYLLVRLYRAPPPPLEK